MVAGTERRVQERLLAGDPAGAATEAIKGFGPKVAGYMRTLFRNDADVAEAFSQWSENLWKGLPSFEGRSSFQTWALRLAWNAALNILDQAHRVRERRLNTAELSSLVDTLLSASAIRLERRRQQLQELRRLLTPEEQTLLFLRIDQHLSWTEVAEVLCKNQPHPGDDPLDPDTISKRFERLKKRLADLARQQGLVD